MIVSLVLALTVDGALAAPAERRVAFVVGNANYQRFPSLPNPRNDAEDVTSALKKAGFQVYGGIDLTRETLRDQLRQFARAAQGADAALAYYAGHGLQYKGRNYIVPIDAKLQDEFDLEYETLRVDDIVGELSRADGARILILDACRNLPLKERSDRNPFDTGLAKISGRGLVVAYATQANALAYDGTGRNSIFTSAFLKIIDEPGLDLPQFFQRVSIAVDTQSRGQQTPELSLSYPGKFVFNRSETDRDVWRKIRDSSDPVVLRDFIKRYPESDFVDLAKLRLKLQDDWRLLEAQQEQRKKDAEVRRNAEQAAHEAEAKMRILAEEQVEKTKRAEAARLADEARQRVLAEEQIEKTKRAEAARLADEARQRVLAEEQVEKTKRAEAARLADEARQRVLAEEQVEKTKRAEAARLADEARQRVLAEEQIEKTKRAEAARLADEARQRVFAEEQAEKTKRAAIAAQEAELEQAAVKARRPAFADNVHITQDTRKAELPTSVGAQKSEGMVGPDRQGMADFAAGNNSQTAGPTALAVADHPEERIASLEAPSTGTDTIASKALGEARLAYNTLQPSVQTTNPTSQSAFPGDAITRDRLVRETKSELGRIGCIDERPNQVWNSKSREALARYARHAKLQPPPLEPTQQILQDLRGRPAHFCPLLCGPGQHANGNRCVAIEKPKPPAPEPKPIARRPKPEPKPIVQRPKPTPEASRPKAKPIREAIRPKPAVAMPRPTPAPPQAPVSSAARPMIGIGF
ncbi:caspase family protein [Methylobacterium longum]|uniref:Caspase family protein n=1 Tax=Methylobacterium longum TaxID=767694 RepID=A0ABT8ATT5_9HYPH|nr:caspase family protein [Methylobacterium longum]MDN3573362.1 caspase family protein [Methylobacterium longum]